MSYQLNTGRNPLRRVTGIHPNNLEKDMGFFSFKTNDTRRSIWNKYSDRKTFRVYMTDHLGNQWVEDDYDGYGVFGGKDFYELLAEMNDLRSKDSPPEDHAESMRSLGIDLWYSGKPFISPQLTQKPRKKSTGRPPKDCPNQGYFS